MEHDCAKCEKRETCEKGQEIAREIFDAALRHAENPSPMTREEVCGAIIIFTNKEGEWIYNLAGMMPENSMPNTLAKNLIIAQNTIVGS